MYKITKISNFLSLLLPNNLYIFQKRASQIKNRYQGEKSSSTPFQPHLHHFLNASNTLARSPHELPQFRHPSTMRTPFTIKPTDNTHQTMRWRVSTNAYKSIVARNRSFCCHRKCSITDTG